MPELENPIQRLAAAFALYGSRIAISDRHGELSYAELGAQVHALALALRKHLGETPQVVALCAKNHHQHVVAMMAIFLSGHIWVPLNPRNGVALNNKQANRVRPALIISDSDCLSCFELPQEVWICTGSGNDISLQQKMRPYYGDSCSLPSGGLDTPMCIKFTGGTTGEPKGVVQTRRTIAAVMDNLQHHYCFTIDDVNLSVAPLSHGAFHLLLPIFAVGGRQRILEPTPSAILAAMQLDGSVAFMPPTLIYKLIDAASAESMHFPKLRELIYSAAPMPVEKIKKALAVFGPCLATFYGQVEAPVTIAAMSSEEMASSENIASVGRPCKHTEVRIDGATQCGDVGEILARGPVLMAGYFEEPEKTNETLIDGWLHTGDLGYLDSRGYLFINGRAKEMIISGGFNIYPSEVEQAILAYPGISEAVVFSVDDDYWGERIEAGLVMHNGQAIDIAALSAFIREKLGAIYVPKKFFELKELPRNPVGKVVRREIKALFYNKH